MPASPSASTWFDAGGAPLGSYVLKMAPAGVVRRGNTDVFRQAPLAAGA